MRSCVLVWRSRLRMVVVAAALVGSTLTAWTYASQEPALSDAQKDRLKERDKLYQEARALRAQGKMAEAIRAGESMLAIERDVLGTTSDAAIRSMRRLAQWNEDRSDWAAARKGRTEVLAVLTQKFGKDTEDVIEARWALETVETLSRASDHDRRTLKDAIRVEQQAKELLAERKVNEAVPLLRQVLAVKKDVLGERTSSYVVALLNLGLGLQNQGQSDEALGCYKTALPISQQICNDSHTLLALNLEYIAGVLIQEAKHAEARQYLERALKIYQVVYPQERYPAGHYFLAHVLYRIGCELDHEGKYVEARRSLEQACEMYERLYPDETYPQGNRDLALSLNALAAALANQRNYSEARRYFERALEMNHRLYPKDKYPQGHPELARALGNLGNLLDATGNSEEARPYLEQALEMLQAAYPAKTNPQGHPEIAGILDIWDESLRTSGIFQKHASIICGHSRCSEALYPKERYPRGHRDLTVVLVDLGRLCPRDASVPGSR